MKRLTPTQVQEIRELYADGTVTQEALAREHGVSEMSIWNLLHGKTWPEAGGPLLTSQTLSAKERRAIRWLAEAGGWSQREIAGLFGRSPTTINNLLTGRTYPA